MALSNTAPITSLIMDIEVLINASVVLVAKNIATVLTPVVAAGFGLYVLLLVVNAWRLGGASDPPAELFIRFISWALIIGVGLNAEAYATTIIPILTGIPNDLAAAFPGSSLNENSLDTLALTYINIITEGFRAASKLPFLLGAFAYLIALFNSILVILTLTPFLILATALLLIAKIGIAIVAMIGPLFFAFLLFPATRQYFSAWLNTAFSYALIPLLIAVVAGIGIGISSEFFPSGEAVNTINIIIAGLSNLILLVVLNKISGIASSLSAGGINDSTNVGEGAKGAISGLGKAGGSVGRGGKKAAGYLKSKVSGNSVKNG